MSVAAVFAILWGSINLKEFVEGLTEIRIVNLIPVPAGILFGPPAALGCAVGNLVIDLFYDYGDSVWLGFVANFLMAYIPYKMWYMFAGRALHVHTWKRLLIFIGSACTGCLICSWILSSGLQLFDHLYENLFLITFVNNMIFTLVFGLPIFIIVTSEKIKTGFSYPEWNMIPDIFKLRERKNYKKIGITLVAADTVFLLLLFVGEINRLYPANSIFMRTAAILSALTTLALCLFPLRKEA